MKLNSILLKNDLNTKFNDFPTSVAAKYSDYAVSVSLGNPNADFSIKTLPLILGQEYEIEILEVYYLYRIKSKSIFLFNNSVLIRIDPFFNNSLYNKVSNPNYFSEQYLKSFFNF